MDFIKRLFGATPAPPVVMDDADSAVPEPTESESSLTAVAIDPQGAASTPSTPVVDPAPSTVEVTWHKVTNETGASTYAGDIDGVRVATIVKHEGPDAGREPWEWRLDVPTNGPAAGNARVLRDAKPAAEQALTSWQH